MQKESVTVLGAGSWGTAVAIHLAHKGHKVLLWGHNPEHVAQMASLRCNPRYLADIPFPDSLIPTPDLNECLRDAQHHLIAVPSSAFASVLAKVDAPVPGLTWLTKGVDPDSHQFLSTLVAQRFGKSFPIGILSGPSFAKEVARNLPTALTLASNDAAYQKKIHTLFHFNNLRVYSSTDCIGVQLCGAVKNILAIACGVSDGLQYGANAKGALITRGLAEMSRLGIKLGAKQQTFLGLAGVGDLVVTCTDDQSRNRRFGLHLGHGVSIDEALRKIGQVVEGMHNAAQIDAIAKEHHIEMPICTQVNALIQGLISPQQAVQNLMTRPAKGE